MKDSLLLNLILVVFSKPMTDPNAFDVVGRRGSNGPYSEERS